MNIWHNKTGKELLVTLRDRGLVDDKDCEYLVTEFHGYSHLIREIQIALKDLPRSAFDESIFRNIWKKLEKYTVERFVRLISSLTLAINGIISIIYRLRR